MVQVLLDVITAGEGQSVLVSIIDDVQSVQVQKSNNKLHSESQNKWLFYIKRRV